MEGVQDHKKQMSLWGLDLLSDLTNFSDCFHDPNTRLCGSSPLTWPLCPAPRSLDSHSLHPTHPSNRIPSTFLSSLTPAPRSYYFVSCIPLALLPSFYCKKWNLGMSDLDGTGLPETYLLERSSLREDSTKH